MGHYSKDPLLQVCDAPREKDNVLIPHPVPGTVKTTAMPVSTLPSEVLAKMFRCTKEANTGNDNPFSVYDDKEPGYAIAAVCRVWRDIVLRDCPCMWANLCVDIGQGIKKRASLECPVAMVLARSRDRPLDIQFKACREELDTASMSVLELLLGENTRWRSVILSLMSFHLPTLAHQRSAYPGLASCHLLMELPDRGLVNEIQAFELATSLVHLTTSGLGPSTSVLHPSTCLTLFMDIREEITIENIERILTSLSEVNGLKNLEMQYFRIVGDGQYRPNTVSLPRVTQFRVGCKSIMDLVTLPTLKALFMEPGFLSWTDFANMDLEPDTLASVYNFLQRSQCQATLHLLEFRNVRLTFHIVDILRLCFSLDSIVLTCRFWQNFTDAAFAALLRELGQKNTDDSLASAPILTSLTLKVDYSQIPTILSCFNEDLVKTMETRTNSLGGRTFCVSINVENPVATLPNFTRAHHTRLIHCREMGSSCRIKVGCKENVGPNDEDLSMFFLL